MAVRRRGAEDFQRTVEAASEVGRQDFDVCVGRQCADVADAFDEMAGAAVAQIIAVHEVMTT